LSRFRIHHVSALSSPLYLPSQNGGAVAASARGTGGWCATLATNGKQKVNLTTVAAPKAGRAVAPTNTTLSQWIEEHQPNLMLKYTL